MRLTRVLFGLALLCCVPSLAMASIGGNAFPEYNSAGTGTLVNTTVDLIPLTSTVSGNVWGLQCVFASGTTVGTDNIKFYVDGSAARTIQVSGLSYPQESNAAGQWFTGWIPMNIAFTSSIHVTVDNTPQGNYEAVAVNCFISWGKN